MNKKLLYILFAILCSGVNLGVQKLVHSLYQGNFELYLGMGSGTVAGFVLKYCLDKFFVFEDSSKNLKEEMGKFSMYTFLAVWTTLLFMGVEILFEYSFSHPQARYIGGAIGLAIGYVLKYYLDARFVFQVEKKAGLSESR